MSSVQSPAGYRGACTLSVVAVVPQARSAPLPGGATASGGVVPQSPNCSAGREEDEGCVPRGPGSPTSPGGPVLPPVTPPAPPSVTPPITLPVGPLVPPPGIPPEELSNFIWGWAKATLHIHDENQDVTYTSSDVPLLFIKANVQDMPGNTQYLLVPINLSPTPGEEEGRLWMTWTVTGRVFDCTVEGEAIITFPVVDPRRDPNRLAYGS